MTHHPHLHCIVPGGGLSPGGERWIPCKRGFFLPARVLSRLFRRLFLEQLAAVHDHPALTDVAGAAIVNIRPPNDNLRNPIRCVRLRCVAPLCPQGLTRPFFDPRATLIQLRLDHQTQNRSVQAEFMQCNPSARSHSETIAMVTSPIDTSKSIPAVCCTGNC